VHRDIKPENILFEGREALVTDFGIARLVGVQLRGDRITDAGVVVGTPRYMSPEQAAGDPSIDARADVYALGCITFEMLTGRPPFTGGGVRSLQVIRALDHPPSPRAERREVPVAVDRAVRASMAKDPAERLPSARAFIEALVTPLPLSAVPGGMEEGRRLRMQWLIAIAIITAMWAIFL
jgi:serine/threonine-protein kinase